RKTFFTADWMAIGWKAMRALACFCDLRELAPQLTHFLETLGHVAHDGNYATHADRLALQQHNCELDGDCRAVLAKGGNREQITFSVAATAGFHRLAKAIPVSLP